MAEKKTTVEVLRGARALIDSPSKWLKGSPVGRGTHRNCAISALCVARGVEYGSPSISAKDTEAWPEYVALANACGNKMVGDWNDSHTHAEVLALFDKAIAECEA